MVRNDKVKEKIEKEIEDRQPKLELLIERRKDIEESIERYKKSMVIDAQLRAIKIKGMKRLTPIWEYEKDEEYQRLLLENTKLLFEQEATSDKATLQKLEKSLEDNNKQLFNLENNINTYKKRMEKYD